MKIVVMDDQFVFERELDRSLGVPDVLIIPAEGELYLERLRSGHPAVELRGDPRFRVRELDRARRVAYLFHPSEPRARIEEHEPWVRAQGWQVERAEVAGFSMLLVERSR